MHAPARRHHPLLTPPPLAVAAALCLRHTRSPPFRPTECFQRQASGRPPPPVCLPALLHALLHALLLCRQSSSSTTCPSEAERGVPLPPNNTRRSCATPRPTRRARRVRRRRSSSSTLRARPASKSCAPRARPAPARAAAGSWRCLRTAAHSSGQLNSHASTRRTRFALSPSTMMPSSRGRCAPRRVGTTGRNTRRLAPGLRDQRRQASTAWASTRRSCSRRSGSSPPTRQSPPRCLLWSVLQLIAQETFMCNPPAPSPATRPAIHERPSVPTLSLRAL